MLHKRFIMPQIQKEKLEKPDVNQWNLKILDKNVQDDELGLLFQVKIVNFDHFFYNISQTIVAHKLILTGLKRPRILRLKMKEYFEENIKNILLSWIFTVFELIRQKKLKYSNNLVSSPCLVLGETLKIW